MEGQILGFDEYMNLVLDEAEEVMCYLDACTIACFPCLDAIISHIESGPQ